MNSGRIRSVQKLMVLSELETDDVLLGCEFFDIQTGRLWLIKWFLHTLEFGCSSTFRSS